jgi:hypothetical protein
MYLHYPFGNRFELYPVNAESTGFAETFAAEFKKHPFVF